MDQLWVQALFWGAVSGGALVIGAAIGFLVRVPKTVVAAVMAFGSGVLISALSFELMEEAFQEAGTGAAAVGFRETLLIARGRLLASAAGIHEESE